MSRPSTTATFSLPLGPESRWGLFLDLDGSLLDECSRPERVVAGTEVIRLLGALQQTFNGALAIISGRPVRDIDRILYPLRLPCAGLHGAERRSCDGTLTRLDVDQSALAQVRAALNVISVKRCVELEDKELGFAIHLRSTPENVEAAEDSVTQVAERSRGAFRVLRGRKVIELIPNAASTLRAARAFMEESVFSRRRPLMFAHYHADVNAFEVARERNGVAVAVGDAAPPTMHRVASPRECRFLLSELVNLGHLGLVA